LSKKKFGEVIRSKREAKGISLREMAKKLNLSPTYLSKVERDEIPPPAVERIVALAQFLGLPSDELFALADRVPDDLLPIIKGKPTTVPELLRLIDRLTDEQVRELSKEIDQRFPTRPPVSKARNKSSQASL
jgi:transcriptional regulator with XRE-family HTH domain